MATNEKKVLIENKSEVDEKFLFNDQTQIQRVTLKVRGGEFDPAKPDKKPTDPNKLASAILKVLSKEDHVRILSVGPRALNIAMQAFRIAAQEVESRTNGAVLVCRQSEYEAIIADKKTKGICTRVFGITIKEAL
jgi:stage V sporulation protein SpoVS